MAPRPFRAAGMFIFRRLGHQIEYLLMQASYGDYHWTPPKGFLEPDEDDFTAALRETTEEAGYTKNDLKVYEDISKSIEYEVKGKLKTVVWWLAELVDPQKPPTLSHEHLVYKWLSKEEAIIIAKYKEMADLIDYFDEKIKNLN